MGALARSPFARERDALALIGNDRRVEQIRVVLCHLAAKLTVDQIALRHGRGEIPGRTCQHGVHLVARDLYAEGGILAVLDDVVAANIFNKSVAVVYFNVNVCYFDAKHK